MSNRIYIGSTSNFPIRVRKHINELNRNVHHNPYLQNSWNKYGKDNFRFDILEYDVKNQYATEQLYLNDLSTNNIKCFNLSFEAGSGGGDSKRIESFVLDLKGNIIGEYKGIYNAFRSVGSSYHNNYNTDSVVNRKYRIVTKDFYINNQEIISTWDKHVKSEMTIHKSINKANSKMVSATINDRDYTFKNASEASRALGISKERVRVILKSSNITNKYNLKYLFP